MCCARSACPTKSQAPRSGWGSAASIPLRMSISPSMRWRMRPLGCAARRWRKAPPSPHKEPGVDDDVRYGDMNLAGEKRTMAQKQALVVTDAAAERIQALLA